MENEEQVFRPEFDEDEDEDDDDENVLEMLENKESELKGDVIVYKDYWERFKNKEAKDLLNEIPNKSILKTNLTEEQKRQLEKKKQRDILNFEQSQMIKNDPLRVLISKIAAFITMREE